MARNRFSSEILGRKAGGSVLARAAYNHRDQYRDERTGKLTDDNRADRDDLEWDAFFAENIGDVPQWWSESRERIFNELEKREDRSTRPNDAQLAYDFKISLPHELNAEQRKELISEWALEQAAKGYVVDVALHKPNARQNDIRNYHAHILIPMRPIERDGWGNKFRAPGDSRQDFEKWAHQNLREWKQRFSELGAEHLERAGFHEEAARFLPGHLSRPQRAKAAYDRGDTAEFERLLDEPKRYMGPAASAMERNNMRTRTGDINREIEQRNELHGPAREVRRAFALADGDRESFVKALSEKDLLIACVTDQEAALSRFNAQTHFTRRLPEYRTGEHVVITEEGQIYRLNPTTTGANWKQVFAFAKVLSEREFGSMESVLEEQNRRSRISRVDRDEVIGSMMGDSRIIPIPVSELPAKLKQQYDHLDPDTLPTVPIRLTDKTTRHGPRTQLPFAADMRVKGTDGEQLWWAYNSSKTPEGFHTSLQERRLHVARVTAQDALDSQSNHWQAKRFGRYSPILTEGEYIVASERGSLFRLDEKSVGHERREVRAFMSALEAKPMPSLREVKNQLNEKRLKELEEARETPNRANILKFDFSLTTTARALGRGAAKGLDVVGGVLESLVGGTISPEERKLAQAQDHENKLEAERAERRRSGGIDR